MKIENAIKTLVKHLNEDPLYRETWKSNIIMSFHDEWIKHHMMGLTYEEAKIQISTKAAENFLNLLCMEKCD